MNQRRFDRFVDAAYTIFKFLPKRYTLKVQVTVSIARQIKLHRLDEIWA